MLYGLFDSVVCQVLLIGESDGKLLQSEDV